MKKILALLLVVSLCFSLAGCIVPYDASDDTPKKETGEPSGDQSKSENEEKELVFGLNETAAFSELKFTAHELKESNGTDFFTPEAGNVFVGIKFTVENISAEEQTVSSILMFEGYVDDVKSSESFSATCVFDEGTLDGTIATGKKLVGWYAMEVPQNWANIELHIQSDWLSNSSAKFVFTK